MLKFPDPEPSFNSIIDYIEYKEIQQLVSALESQILKLGYNKIAGYHLIQEAYGLNSSITNYILLDHEKKKAILLLNTENGINGLVYRVSEEEILYDGYSGYAILEE